MKNVFLSFICLLSLVIMFSCEVDNYNEPDGALTGRVIDAITGKPIQTEQPNGYRIKYKEISWSENATDQFLWGKPDGSFNHTKLFAGTYEVTAVEGAFADSETEVIEVKSNKTTELEFKVMPYLSFKDVSVEKISASEVMVRFTLFKNIAEAIVQDYRILASSQTEYIGINPGGSELSVSLPETAINEEDLEKPIEVKLGNYEVGKTYYIRIGARCKNPSNRYNMTEVIEVKM